jgi:hypothetical protein
MGRKRKYAKSYVISMRISDEELKDITDIMAYNQIKRVSDLMRQAIGLIRENPGVTFPHGLRLSAHDQQPVFHTYL